VEILANFERCFYALLIKQLVYVQWHVVIISTWLALRQKPERRRSPFDKTSSQINMNDSTIEIPIQIRIKSTEAII
jgi:hypothetical protein